MFIALSFDLEQYLPKLILFITEYSSVINCSYQTSQKKILPCLILMSGDKPKMSCESWGGGGDLWYLVIDSCLAKSRCRAINSNMNFSKLLTKIMKNKTSIYNHSSLFCSTPAHLVRNCVHGKERTACCNADENKIEELLVSTLFNVVNSIVQHCRA